MKKVSVVILNWNGAKLMEQYLPSVVANCPEEIAEVVVADNGSTDSSVQMLKDQFPTVRLILFDTNYGFAEGYNRALDQIDTEFTVLLNSDVEVTPGWLNAPLEVMEEDSLCACVQPKILSALHRDSFEYAGAAGGYMDRYGYPFCRGRIFSVVEKDNRQYDRAADILWASGACMFVRTAVYKSEGGLDAGFFAHQEEIDLCWRLRSRGFRLVCTPQSVVYHVGGATLNMESPRKTFLNFRNNLLMLYKNLTEEDLRPVMSARFFLDYIAAFKFLAEGHFKSALAVFEARRAFFQMRSDYEPKRKENLSKRRLNDIPELIHASLLYCFYAKGKKTFTDLMGNLDK